MASDLHQQIVRVQAKTRVVAEKYQSMREACAELRNEVADLKAALHARDEEIRILNVKLESLTMATHLKATAGDVEATKVLIANLVREVDRCIADLLE